VRKRRIGEPRIFNSTFSMQVKDGNIRVQAERGGGPEWDIGIYCQNAVRYLFADEPTHVWAAQTNSGDRRFREVPETVSAVMKFPEGRIGMFVCSFGAADRSRYEVVGTKGNVVMEPAYEYAEGLAYELTIGEKTRKKKFGKSDQFAPELLYFSDCILKDREPEPSGTEGLIDVLIIEALHRSIRSGQWEDVGLPERRRRPTLKQEIRKPGIQKPDTVNVQQPH
jgi:glucose-fructose oxidoreductase